MPPLNTAKSLRIFARLLDYPDAALLQHLQPLREALYREAAVSTVRLAEIDTLFDWMSEQDEIDAQAHYVELFDCGRATGRHRAARTDRGLRIAAAQIDGHRASHVDRR